MLLMIILKVTNKTGFHPLSGERNFGKKHRGGQIDPLTFLRSKSLDMWFPKKLQHLAAIKHHPKLVL